MKRRTFIAGLGSAAAWPVVARGQQAALPVVGLLFTPTPLAEQRLRKVHQGLAEMGFVDGRNVNVTLRWAEDQPERRPAQFAEMIRRNAAVIAVDTVTLAQAAKVATQTIPVVFSAGGDPVAFGIVASLNRPGGNLTGVAALNTALTAKRLDLLHSLVPTADTIAMFVGSTGSQFTDAETSDLHSAARALRLRVVVFDIADQTMENDIEAAFAAIVKERIGALLISANALLQRERGRIVTLAARHAIPTMFFQSGTVEAGGLLSYGPDLPDLFRQVGVYVGRILKGEKPGDLPVQQPTRFHMALNLKTAKALGIEVPLAILLGADEVIE